MKTENINKLITHIFGKEKDKGLDYLSMLVKHPTAKLPVLNLWSTEQATGKSTFIEMVEMLIGGHFSYINDAFFRGSFKQIWCYRSVLVIEDLTVSGYNITWLKKMATRKKDIIRPHNEIPFMIDLHCKFIVTTNIGVIKSRSFWNVNTKKIKHREPLLFGRMCNEMPAFYNFLLSREITTDEFLKAIKNE